ncbi:MAG: phosphonate metabolism protein/1,5-bisphosphokinase (PRPP-forming) PhnN [Burkholderiaceae bacterium]
MTHRLVYVVGPSGAGKDSVLHGLRRNWGDADPAHWARRTITRPADAGGELHEAVDAQGFGQLCRMGAFAMHWNANGLSYGVRQSELLPIRDGRWVFVNGSRAWVPQLRQQWPQATVVYIGASPAVLAQRLAARGRESAQAVAERLARQVPAALPPETIQIENDSTLADAVSALHEALVRCDRAGGVPSSN